MYKNIIKPVLDVLISLLALILLSPVLILAVITLCINNGGNPFFVQRRPGKNERLFSIIKLKTMNDKRDVNGDLLPDVDRLSKVGSFIRKTSLDEIPQLINVCKGDMSLIGPRPLLIEYLTLYNSEQRARHHVKPGITGWAQVNGRNAISWKKKFEYDVWYVNNFSFWLDLKIAVLTIKKVILRDGISSSSSVTMEKFNGN